MKFDEVKDGIASLWDNVSEGWRHLWRSATGALTRFRPGEQTNLPPAAAVDDQFYLPGRSWAMLGGDVFEDDHRVVVRIEVPGMDKQDVSVEVHDGALVVSGEKRFERETTEGRWRVMQCAYGSFRRVVPLHAAVRVDEAKATYRNGVVRVELPKAAPGRPGAMSIKVD